jgi:N-acetylneuraminate synthase
MIEIIVEIGLNHLGSEERAWRMLQGAIAASIDAVTFQIREKAFYENEDPLRRRLTDDFYRRAVTASHAGGKRCGIAIADESSVEKFHSFGVDFWKTLSWDFNNPSLKKRLQATGKPLLMSTGLSSMEAIVEMSVHDRNIALIHTQLSHNIEDVNLKAIAEMRNQTRLPVAFGLHCAHHDVLKTALGFEPSALLFYIKEEGCERLFDDEHALALSELKPWADALRSLERALGTGTKSGAEKPTWVVQ